MTTGRKHIPINNHGPATGANPATNAGQAVEQAAEEQLYEQGQVGSEVPEEREALVAERDALSDSLLRLRAEFENFRKRASRELIEARVCAQGDLLNDLLPVLDNLERALDAAEHHEEGKVLEGVKLTRNMFADLVARVGMEEIEGVGTAFDPQIHDAMLVRPSEYDEGVVAAVLERGYRQGDRVLRPARVVVSAGPPAAG